MMFVTSSGLLCEKNKDFQAFSRILKHTNNKFASLTCLRGLLLVDRSVPGTSYRCENLWSLIPPLGFCSWKVRRTQTLFSPHSASRILLGCWGDELCQLEPENTPESAGKRWDSISNLSIIASCRNAEGAGAKLSHRWVWGRFSLYFHFFPRCPRSTTNSEPFSTNAFLSLAGLKQLLKQGSVQKVYNGLQGY